jgi:hypothetical protein
VKSASSLNKKVHLIAETKGLKSVTKEMIISNCVKNSAMSIGDTNHVSETFSKDSEMSDSGQKVIYDSGVTRLRISYTSIGKLAPSASAYAH